MESLAKAFPYFTWAVIAWLPHGILQANMEELWSDIRLVSSDGHVFPAHRFMLSLHSEVFREEFIQLDQNKATTGDTESSSKSPDKQNRQEKGHAGKIPELKIGFQSAATAIMVRFVYSSETAALGNIKTNEEGYKDLATCVQVCILAHKFAMPKLHDLIWPQILNLSEKQLQTTPATVLSAIEEIYAGIPNHQCVALPLVDMIARDFEKLWTIPEIERFAANHAIFGWHLSVRLQVAWKKKTENSSKHTDNGKDKADT
ncbi:hypothetical protein CFIMG_005443RA [Ceratocystis fimbriata CBS 114723]|uniref:BTB domain-containing protein n=1 Tax=Ceratocystis fimbriata CBS 114723 TaxID=1035309 RepID=A0A2C5WWL6_9PEZI|nr:hypothetical protein CFIMG_005443RA [Ceratocystis fimbriata CBS 114723]